MKTTEELTTFEQRVHWIIETLKWAADLLDELNRRHAIAAAHWPNNDG